MNKNVFIVAGTALVSLSAGAVGGYLYARKQLVRIYDEILEEEVARTRAYYRQRSMNGGFDTAIDAAAALIPAEEPLTSEMLKQIATEMGYTGLAQEDLEEHNIFDGTVDLDEEEVAKEEASRSENEPYVISVEEYLQSETGYRQFTLTYFEGDDVLVDEHEKPIDEVEKYVGDANLKKFGHRSRDANVVYIRNDKADLEFEVIRSKRSYTEDVLHFVKPVQKPARMRRADV